jgi:hypothetical protein
LTTDAGTQISVPFDYACNINDQISTVRVQKTIGHDEENLTVAARAIGEYEIRVGIAGAGQYYPLRIKNGDVAGTPSVVADFTPTTSTLGGVFAAGAFTVFNGPGANRLEVWPAPVGFSPALRARGSDTNVGLSFDLQGNNSFAWTGNSFGTVYAQLNANGFILPNDFTPTSPNYPGVKGQTCSDADYFYKCVATNIWKRVALNSW